MDERRGDPRVRLNVRVNVKEKVKAYAKNISASGICIITAKPLKKDKYVTLEFNLPEGTSIKVTGKVVWNQEINDENTENGIAFISVGEYEKDRLKEYVNGQQIL